MFGQTLPEHQLKFERFCTNVSLEAKAQKAHQKHSFDHQAGLRGLRLGGRQEAEEARVGGLEDGEALEELELVIGLVGRGERGAEEREAQADADDGARRVEDAPGAKRGEVRREARGEVRVEVVGLARRQARDAGVEAREQGGRRLAQGGGVARLVGVPQHAVGVPHDEPGREELARDLLLLVVVRRRGEQQPAEARRRAHPHVRRPQLRREALKRRRAREPAPQRARGGACEGLLQPVAVGLGCEAHIYMDRFRVEGYRPPMREAGRPKPPLFVVAASCLFKWQMVLIHTNANNAKTRTVCRRRPVLRRCSYVLFINF